MPFFENQVGYKLQGTLILATKIGRFLKNQGKTVARGQGQTKMVAKL